MTNFADLGLPDTLLQAIEEQGYRTPSPIQEKAIPLVLEGKDVMAAAQTGTGKTAGFALPILANLSRGPKAQSNSARALILTPTRELASQVGESVASYAAHTPLRSTVVFGGVKINPQMMRLRRGVDVLVATPGRLLDLHQQNAVNFKQLEVLVLDEADRMLDMGFIHDIRKILALLPAKHQSLLFSATFSDDIRKLAKSVVKQPVEISVSPRNSTKKSVTQWLCPVDKKRKGPLLTHLIKTHDWQQVLVFTRTKRGANQLTRKLQEEGISAAAIHGNKGQGARTKALADFKSGAVRILVATDIAARGLDIDQLPQVINFDLPNVPEDYVHRIGRTGRAGATGQALSLVSADEYDQLVDIERLIKKCIPREEIDGFEAIHSLPPSQLDTRPIKPRRPKKPKANHQDGQRSGDNASGHKPPSSAKPNTGRGRGRGNKPQQNGANPNAPTGRRRRPSNRPKPSSN